MYVRFLSSHLPYLRVLHPIPLGDVLNSRMHPSLDLTIPHPEDLHPFDPLHTSMAATSNALLRCHQWWHVSALDHYHSSDLCRLHHLDRLEQPRLLSAAHRHVQRLFALAVPGPEQGGQF